MRLVVHGEVIKTVAALVLAVDGPRIGPQNALDGRLESLGILVEYRRQLLQGPRGESDVEIVLGVRDPVGFPYTRCIYN